MQVNFLKKGSAVAVAFWATGQQPKACHAGLECMPSTTVATARANTLGPDTANYFSR